MRIQITGSRDFTDRALVYEAIWSQISYENYQTVTDAIVVHGGAKGADALSGSVAKQFDLDTEVYLANWDDCGSDCNPSHWRYRFNGDPYCPRAGYTRNQRMLDSGSDVCLAFFKTGAANKGTRMMAKLCAKAGIPVIEYWEN